jgi:hypothetical protein
VPRLPFAPRVGRLPARPPCPGWAAASSPRLGRDRYPAGPVPPARPASGQAAAFRPGQAAPSARPAQAGISSRPGSLPRPECVQAGTPGPGRAPMCRLATSCVAFRPGWAGTAFPGRITPPPGRIICPRPRYTSTRPRFATSGILYSSGIDSSLLFQSWDASRLGLAHSPPSYAGLGTPLGSDQHIPPLLVSLILRRRIRLMTW